MSAVDMAGESEWKLVWSDDFDKDGRLDAAVWNYETGFVRNEEAQWYQDGNAYCKDGKLIIEARKETGRKNPLYDAESDDWRKSRKFIDYTSSCVTTAGRRGSWLPFGLWAVVWNGLHVAKLISWSITVLKACHISWRMRPGVLTGNG